MAREKRLYTPQLSEANVRNLYQISGKFGFPMSKMLNIIVATALEELADVDPDEWTVCEPVRTEDPASTGEASGLHPPRTPGHVLLFRHPAQRNEPEAVSDLSGVCEPA